MELNLRDGGGGFFLPEAIIFDVLSRLPAKVLCRLRCVCKWWRTLISNKAFILAQKSRAGPLIAGVFESRCTSRKMELRVMDMNGSILKVFKDVPWYLAPTRLDLICLYNMQGGAAMIVDPAAGRMLAIGGPNPRIGTQMYHSQYIIGRAAPSGAYKVLCINGSFDGNDQLSEIATINDSSSKPTWRRRSVPPLRTLCNRDQKATINGILYFLSYIDYTLQDRRYHVVSYNLESEEWTEKIDGPAMGLRKAMESWQIALAELKGTLNMVQTVNLLTNQEGYVHYINIWLLIDSKKSSWVKQYTITMPQNWRHVKALDVLGDGRILLLNEKRDQNIYRPFYQFILQFYNPSTEAFTDIMELPNDFIGEMVFYTGSLLPILTNGRIDELA